MRTEGFRGVLLSTLIMALLMASAALLPIYSVEATPSDLPVHIHLTWVQNDTSHTIVVTWKTTTAEAGDNVLYDIVPRGGNPELYGYSATGGHHTYTGAGGYIHDVELTGLSPDTRYYFICGGDEEGYSAERSFRTPPEAPTSIRFVAGGDSRYGSETNWPEERDDISREMAKFNPSFVLFTGDFVMTGSDQDEWNNWFAAAQEYWVDNDGLTIPMITCIGNHEVYYPQPSDYDPENEATNYYEQFCLPGNERWYSLDFGPDLHITVLDSEILSRSDAWNEQLSWLESDLAEHESCTWKIAIFHRPAYSAGYHGQKTSGNDAVSRELIREDWVPLFDEYHVDLVVNAHDHDYERTYPIYQNAVQPYGTTYVVSGGWGAPMRDVSPKWWTAYCAKKYSFTVVDISGGTLHMRAVDRYGATFDECYIRNYRVDVSISPEGNIGWLGENVTFSVEVANIGKFDDNYELAAVPENAEWVANLADNLVSLAAGISKNVILAVTIPPTAEEGDNTVVTVSATSQADNTVENSASCIAHAIPIVREVEVSISPKYQENVPGGTLKYTVAVTNRGNVPDTYDLSVNDTENWASWGERRPITISGAYPENSQLKIVIPYDPDMRPDYGDLRFYEDPGVGELPYWIESHTADEATVWVRRLENKDSTIYVYYGNPLLESAEDEYAFFEVFDDFEDGVLDGWSFSGQGGWEISTFHRYEGNYGAQNEWIPGYPDDHGYARMYRNITLSAPGRIYFWWMVSCGWDAKLEFRINGVRRATIEGEVDWNERVFDLPAGTSEIMWAYAKDGDEAGLDRGFVDYIRVRKRVFPEPTAIVGAEESAPVFLFPSGPLSPGGNTTVTLTAWIPEDAVACTRDNITVTATSQTDNTVENSASCIAHAVPIIRSVEVSISPENQENLLGETLEYTVTVTNTGTVPDNYDLTAGDNESWGPTLGVGSLTVPPFGENRTTTLTVTIPENAVPCTEDNITVTVISRADNTVENSASCIAHVLIVRGVEVSISPENQENLPSGTLDYEVTVTNTGNVPDNYDLSASDNEGWGMILDNGSLSIPVSESRTTTLTVTIHENAIGCTEDNITVTATSRADNTVENSASCTAHAIPIVYGVEVSISPSYQENLPGGTIEYTVTVTNTGNVSDNYDLSASDNEGWGPILDNGSLSIPVSESRTTALTVAIPENAVPCTEDIITVTATSQADPSVSDNASCIAHAVQLGVEVSISPLFQENLPGGKLEYTVVVKNTSMVLDSYALEVNDNQGWTLELADNLLTVLPENTKPEFLPLADTFVDGQDSPNTPHGESTGLEVTKTADATLLKFDVSSIGGPIKNVALKLYCHRIIYKESKEVNLWGVGDDWEEDVTWNGKPAAETGVLVNDVLEGIPSWWTFQSALLTEYVESQRQGDGIVSLALDYGGADLYASPSGVHRGQSYYSKEADENHPYLEIFLPGETTLTVAIPENAVPCTRDNITVTATSQTNNTVENSASCIAHAVPVVREVEVSISPDYQENLSGGTLDYEVTVTNTGTVPDNYDLMASDNESWGPTLGVGSLTVPPFGENRTATLTVTIPENAVPCTEDIITVTATSQADDTVENSASCIAHVLIVRGVEVSIEPESQFGLIGENVVFTVTVKNTGNVWDNYKLENNDDAGWALKLDNDYLEIPENENRETKLTVFVPNNENLVCTTDNITVIATAVNNAEVTDNDNATVHAVPSWTGTAAFSFVNLYTVNVEQTLDLNQGSKLVVKFYDYSDVFESENVIETFSPPWHVEENEHARHPSIGGENIGVRKARLVLTTDDTSNEIATIASFTVCKDDLRTRYRAIPKEWGLEPTQAGKDKLRNEYRKIPGHWGLSPC